MKLTVEQVSNLTLLADFMEGLNDPNFTMEVLHHECGAPACALGWASTISKLELHSSKIHRGMNSALHTEVRQVFGDVYWRLFSAGEHQHIKTPQQWAAHCRAFLKENGYDITKPDPLKTFMDLALAPVDLEGSNV